MSVQARAHHSLSIYTYIPLIPVLLFTRAARLKFCSPRRFNRNPPGSLPAGVRGNRPDSIAFINLRRSEFNYLLLIATIEEQHAAPRILGCGRRKITHLRPPSRNYSPASASGPFSLLGSAGFSSKRPSVSLSPSATRLNPTSWLPGGRTGKISGGSARRQIPHLFRLARRTSPRRSTKLIQTTRRPFTTHQPSRTLLTD